MTTQILTFDSLLVYHCAPTLSGIKAASLISCTGVKAEQAPKLVRRYNRQAAHKGIRFRILGNWPGRCLVLVYRPEMLAAALSQPSAQRLLAKAGYPAGAELQQMLDHLSSRIGKSGDFPHEIGLFLDYPPEDVEGFIQNKGQNFKFCGYWKVYSNEQQAAALFDQYTQCREVLTNRFRAKGSILQLIAAA